MGDQGLEFGVKRFEVNSGVALTRLRLLGCRARWGFGGTGGRSDGIRSCERGEVECVVKGRHVGTQPRKTIKGSGATTA